MPIVIGAPVGLATGADADDAAVAEALVDAAAGALVAAAVGVADAPVDDEPPDGAADFEELQPATSSAATANAAVDAAGRGRQRRGACNRLCETIESLHEGWVGCPGALPDGNRPLRESHADGLCNRLCNRLS